MIKTLIATPDPEPRPVPSWQGSTGTTSATFTWSITGQSPTDRDPWLIVVGPLDPPRSAS